MLHILKSIQYLTRAKNTLGRESPTRLIIAQQLASEFTMAGITASGTERGEKPVKEACILAVFIFVDLICCTPVSKQQPPARGTACFRRL
jgi:hypothetical protein